MNVSFKTVKNTGKSETKKIVNTIFNFSNLIGLLAILVTIILFTFTIKKKEITFYIDSYISLVDINSLNGSGIKISFDSINVENLYKVNCKLINTGNTAIVNNDYIKNITIGFKEQTTLLKYDIIRNPKNMVTQDIIINNQIILHPDLLNPNDEISFIIYYTVKKKDILPIVTSRIVEGKIININRSDEIGKPNKFIFHFNRKVEIVLFWIMFFWNILFLVLIFWGVFFQVNKENRLLSKVLLFIFMSGGFTLTLLYLISSQFL